MMRNLANLAMIFMISASSAFAGEVPEHFFGKNNLEEKESSAAAIAQNLPLFPILGKSSSAVKIDYFYSASCLPCRDATESIYKAINDGIPIQVSFHPIPGSQVDYDAAVSESVINSASPLGFSLFHFGLMLGDIKDSGGVKFLLSDISKFVDKDFVVQARLENYESWTKNLEASQMIADEVKVTNLPTLVIGNRKYEGFVSHDAFLAAIEDVHKELSEQ